METNNNKKTITIIVVALILLILVVGATYAYFTGNIINNSSKTNVKATTSAIDNIALNQQVTNLHIKINPNDMGENNKQDYYATTDDDKNYEKTENIVSLAELTATGGDKRASYNCEVKVTISIDEGSNMLDSLQEGDASIYLQYGNLLENIDLNDLKNTKSKELTGNITLINNSNDFIRGSLKITNNENNQVDLANKALNVNINTEVTKCELYGTSKIELALRNTSTSNTLSKELTGGMYRYQGTAEQVTDNYICFGTDDQQTCLNDQDKYMYRIIGVTPEGKIKVIKNGFIKEKLDDGNYHTDFAWNNNYQYNSPTETGYCDTFDCDDWGTSTLFKRLNGTSNGNIKGSGVWGETADSNIFVSTEQSSTEYPYMLVGSNWYNLIENHIWLYGNENRQDKVHLFNATIDEIYNIESGKIVANYNTLNTDSNSLVLKNQRWTKTVKAKIGLLQLHDLFYSSNIEDNNLEYDKDEYGQYIKVKTWMSWADDKINSETLMTYVGINNNNKAVEAYHFSKVSTIYSYTIGDNPSVRPVFFLNSDIEISGKGTMEEPYMIKL